MTDSPIENWARVRGVRGLAVEQAVDLDLGQRDRLVARADEAGHPGGVLDQAPGVVGHLHVDQDVAGDGALLDLHLLAVLHLGDLLGWGPDLVEDAPWSTA